jgi:Uma2 family endonuclease
MPAESVTLMTADELLELHLPDKSTELVRGQLIVREPPSSYHGELAAKLAVLVGSFVYAHELGSVFAQDTGFKIASNPDTVRAPDLAYVSRARSSAVGRRGYAAIAPDLVIEILSPGDRPGEVLAKVADWIDAGVRLVWVIDPHRAEAHVHRTDGSLEIVDADGALDGEDVLPGFTCELAKVFN